MKKTLVVAILIVAMILGIVAYAFAIDDLQTVLVSARVNPKFSMTLTPDAENFNGRTPPTTGMLASRSTRTAVVIWTPLGSAPRTPHGTCRTT
jgi:hypothetical protein